MNPVLIYSTTDSREEAITIGKQLVKNKLAACVNIIPNVESIYNWQNELQQDSEFLLIIKTDAKFKMIFKICLKKPIRMICPN